MDSLLSRWRAAFFPPTRLRQGCCVPSELQRRRKLRGAERMGRVSLPFAAWKNDPFAARLTTEASVGVGRTPVSRLFNDGVRRSPSAYSLPTPIGTAAGPFYTLRVTRLIGRGDTTHPPRAEICSVRLSASDEGFGETRRGAFCARRR